MAIPSASEQQGPFPLLRLSNQCFRGDPAYRPSSRALALPASSMVANDIRRREAQNELAGFMLVTDDKTDLMSNRQIVRWFLGRCFLQAFWSRQRRITA